MDQQILSFIQPTQDVPNTHTTIPLPFRGKYKLGGGFNFFLDVHPKKFGNDSPFWSKHHFQLGWFNHHQLHKDDSLSCWALNFFASGDGIFKALALLQRTLGSSIFGDSTGRDIVGLRDGYAKIPLRFLGR